MVQTVMGVYEARGGLKRDAAMNSVAGLLARYWPFANGSGRLLDLFARDVNLGSGPKVTRTSDGFEISCLADDLIGRHLLLSGKFDRSIVQVLLDCAKPGDVLLDVGANIGYVTACFLHRIPASTAICVEPQPGIVDLLRENLARFPGRATVHQAALSDQSGELRFEINTANRGASKLSPDGALSVPAIKASELLASVTRIDLVKIDVEGHEQSVFTAMEGDLARLKPRCILFEDHTGNAAPDGVIGSLLGRLGYDVFGIKKSLFRTSLIPIHSRADCSFSDYTAQIR